MTKMHTNYSKVIPGMGPDICTITDSNGNKGEGVGWSKNEARINARENYRDNK